MGGTGGRQAGGRGKKAGSVWEPAAGGRSVLWPLSLRVQMAEDLEGRRQRKQVLAPRERRWGAAGGRGRLFTYEGDVIVFLESGGASREQVLSLPEREGGRGQRHQPRWEEPLC